MGLSPGDVGQPPTNTNKTNDLHHRFGPATAAVNYSLAEHPEELSMQLPVKTCALAAGMIAPQP